MQASDTFVIAGGLVGAKVAEALRGQGFAGRIVLTADESVSPYERPPLSKDYQQGKAGRERIFVHPPDWYDSRVELLLGTGGYRDRPEAPGGNAVQRPAHGLRPAAAGHRIETAPPARARRGRRRVLYLRRADWP